jgi:hypothetical protein
MTDIAEDTRIYTHKRRPGWTHSSQRVDMTQTLKYLTGKKVDEDGVSFFDFDLNDQITTFKVIV